MHEQGPVTNDREEIVADYVGDRESSRRNRIPGVILQIGSIGAV